MLKSSTERLEIGAAVDVDDLERFAFRRDNCISVLRRNARQVFQELQRVLPTARIGLIEEPAVDDNLHLEFSAAAQHMVVRLEAETEVQVKRARVLIRM